MSHGRMSIDVRVEVSIGGSSQVSIDGSELLSIDAARLSLRIVCSKRAGSENTSNYSLLLQVLLGMHLKEVKKQIYKNFSSKT